MRTGYWATLTHVRMTFYFLDEFFFLLFFLISFSKVWFSLSEHSRTDSDMRSADTTTVLMNLKRFRLMPRCEIRRICFTLFVEANSIDRKWGTTRKNATEVESVADLLLNGLSCKLIQAKLITCTFDSKIPGWHRSKTRASEHRRTQRVYGTN